MENTENAQDKILKIQNVVQSLPLESILSTAELVSTLIPGMPIVIKVLRVLIKWRPMASGLLGTGAQMLGPQSADMNQPDDLGNADEMAEAEDSEIRAMLDEMIAIAAEDGELSPEEEQYLLDVARDAGMDEKVVMAKVKMKCMSNK